MRDAKSAKQLLTERLNKTFSREMVAIALAAYGLLESHADPQLLVIFSAAVIAILQASKAVEAIFSRNKTKPAARAAKVASFRDTQETVTDGPSFDPNPTR